MNSKTRSKNGIIRAGQMKRSGRISLTKKTMIISSKKAIVCACTIVTAVAIFRNGTIPILLEMYAKAQNSPKVASERKTAPEQQPKAISPQYTPSAEAWQALESLTHNQNVWIRQLIGCESGGRPAAINPKDLDGTPSYGLLEFKPETFYGFAKQYAIQVASFMDPNKQVVILTNMIKDHENINWFTQFPACVAKYGQPPAN